MSIRPVRIILGLALVLSAALIPAPPVTAAGTTSIRVVKYAADGATVVDERTISYTEMESQLPVQGDGNTTYYHQGPTFEEDDLWDPGETQNLKSKGAPRGTDLKDLCELVGGMSAEDTVKVSAADGFNKTFDYTNVYDPEPRQGKIVVAWQSDRDGYAPGWGDGMLLVFFAQTTNAEGQHVFGNEDMRQTLPEERWHYFDIYPSTNGYSVKNIDEIAIFSAADEQDGETRQVAQVDVSATVVLPQVALSLNRGVIDYGEVQPGGSSRVVDVGITNVGTTEVDLTLEVRGSDDVAQQFYERSLYVEGAAYARAATIARIERAQTESVETQLKVPADWAQEGRQEAVFVFWAEAVD